MYKIVLLKDSTGWKEKLSFKNEIISKIVLCINKEGVMRQKRRKKDRILSQKCLGKD